MDMHRARSAGKIRGACVALSAYAAAVLRSSALALEGVPRAPEGDKVADDVCGGAPEARPHLERDQVRHLRTFAAEGARRVSEAALRWARHFGAARCGGHVHAA